MTDSRSARVAIDRDARTILDSARGRGIDGVIDQVAARLQKLEAPSANVFVVGRTRVGKSSVINGVLGRELLPIDSVPCTGALVEVVGAKLESLEVDFADGRRLTAAVGSMADFASEERNPGNVRQVARVIARVPDQVLATGLHLFDTPGTESLHPLHERVLLDALFEADCALFVYRAPDMLPGHSELELLQKVQRGVGRIFLVQNEAHDLSREDADAVLLAVQRDLRQLGFEAHRTFRVNARRPGHSTFAALRGALTQLGAEEAPAVKRDAVVRSLLWVGREVEARLVVEERALADPIERVEQRLNHQSRTLDEIRDRVKRVRAGARLEAVDLRRELDRHVEALPKSILGGRTGELFSPGSGLERVAAELEACVNDALEAWLKRADAIVAAAHERIAELARQQLKGVDDQLSELAGVHFQPSASQAAFGGGLTYTPDFVRINPSGLARLGAASAAFVRAGAAPLGKLVGVVVSKKYSPIAGKAADVAVRTALEKLADVLQKPVWSEEQRVAHIRKHLEAEVLQLGQSLSRSVPGVVAPAEGAWEQSLRLHYDSRISLLDDGVRQLLEERRRSVGQARERLDATRQQLLAIRGANSSLQRAAP